MSQPYPVPFTEETLEVRMATTMTGGVSLAVWMGGVAREIDLLRQASNLRRAAATRDRPHGARTTRRSNATSIAGSWICSIWWSRSTSCLAPVRVGSMPPSSPIPVPVTGISARCAICGSISAR